jgi:hypothetical protein
MQEVGFDKLLNRCVLVHLSMGEIMKILGAFVLLISLSSLTYAQNQGIIECPMFKNYIYAYEQPGSMMVMKQIPCGQLVTMVGLENGWARIVIRENVFGYIDARYFKSVTLSAAPVNPVSKTNPKLQPEAQPAQKPSPTQPVSNGQNSSRPLIAGSVIPSNSNIFIEPAGGFETYLVNAFRVKKVPLLVVSDISQADFILKSTIETGGKPGWIKTMLRGKPTVNEDASFQILNARTSVVSFSYSVLNYYPAHGRQSAAEACAKHLVEYIRNGK